MKRTFETLPSSSGAKKPKSDENTEKRSPESAEAQLELVILPEIVNIKTEDAQSIDDHPLLSKPELNLESIVKEEYIVPENTSEIAQTSNEEKKIDVMFPDHVPQASCSLSGIQVLFPLSNQDEMSNKDQGNDIFLENQMVATPDFVKFESGDYIPEDEAKETFRRLTSHDDLIVKKIICGECMHYKPIKVPINCTICPEIFNSSDIFIRHVFNYHRFYVCLACNLTFDINTFQNHLRKIHETRPFLECDACDFSARDRLDWAFHLQSHLQKSLEKIRQKTLLLIERISCPFCMCSHLKKHFVPHLKSEHQFFECVACDYNAASCKDLRRHMLEVHRNGDTFDCIRCRFSAPTTIAYNNHFIWGGHDRGPTKIGDFWCTKCFFSTNTLSPIYYHLQKVHSLFCCIFCDEFETSNESMLKSHINEKHNVPHKQKLVNCNICPFSGEEPGVIHIEFYKDQHKEAKKTILNSIFAKGCALRTPRISQPIDNDSVKQEIGEVEPSSEDVFINEDDIKIEIDFCEIKNE